MRSRLRRPVSQLTAAVLACGLGATAGCGNQQENADSNQQADADLRRELGHRARQVAKAWERSPAAAAWRTGYHPTGAVTQLPRDGLRSKGENRAYQTGRFVLRAKLPAAEPKDGRVTWNRHESLTRPLAGAEETYQALADDSAGTHLTVTGAKLGDMRVSTSRGPATVPAWLFSLKGYDSPLKQAAAIPSKLPRPPIKKLVGVAGGVERLVRISADGRAVTVDVRLSGCHELAAVDEWETRSSVVLTTPLKSRKKDGLCLKRAKSQQTTVKLDRPVGDRAVLDARSGQPLTYETRLRP
ncbi:hypothetical protein [Streptomyces reniochalinae]|uniref:Lipoprotein n=1 Tax=Streptomyces reniochalinae TaxID=2250578 RepID=A0A367EIQ6_9ACTN|nr:hypothetical protein [Streptomyces reniochalinae]RCG17931.1 hypothetical protein DQ392_14620 [Streptomyces reniochalinae]